MLEEILLIDSKDNLMQKYEIHYYPFEVKYKGYNNVVNSINTVQKFKFNAKEYDDELDVT